MFRNLSILLVFGFAFTFTTPSISQTQPTTQQLIEDARARKEAAQKAVLEAREIERKALDALRERKAQLLSEVQAIDRELGENTNPPDPPKPPSLTEISQKVYDLAKAVPVYSGKSGVLDSLSAAYTNAEAKIRLVITGQALTPELEKWDTPEEIVSSTGKDVVKALGTDIDKWRPFFKELQAYLQSLANQGKLTTLAEHARVWGEIGIGLKASK